MHRVAWAAWFHLDTKFQCKWKKNNKTCACTTCCSSVGLESWDFFILRYRVKVRDDITISSPEVNLHRRLAYRWRYYSCWACGTHSVCANAYAYKPTQCIYIYPLNVCTHKWTRIILSTLYTCNWSLPESQCRSKQQLCQISATISCCEVRNDIVGHDHTIRVLLQWTVLASGSIHVKQVPYAFHRLS